MRIVDIIFFRLLGVGILAHETLGTGKSEWSLIVASLCMFLMPDVVKGGGTVPIRIVEKLIGREK